MTAQTDYFQPIATAREIELEAMLAEAVNGCVAQADYIRRNINTSLDSEAIRAVAGLILICQGTWKAIGYTHKERELKAAVAQRCADLIDIERTYLAGCRKNDRTRAGTEKEIARLEELRLAHAA